jgi:hypothetical protein
MACRFCINYLHILIIMNFFLCNLFIHKFHSHCKKLKFQMSGKIFRIYFLLFFGLIFTLAGQTSGQRKGEIAIGIGIPELSNISVRYQVYRQIQTGLSVGWLPRSTFNFGSWNNLISLSGELFYHFGRKTSISDKRLFYVNVGVNFMQEKPYQWNENWWNSYLRIGGEIFSAYNFGMNIDGGFICNLNPDKNWAHMDHILPALGVDFFYRF